MLRKRLWVVACLLSLLVGCGEYTDEATSQESMNNHAGKRPGPFASDGVVLTPQTKNLIPNRYIVRFKEGKQAGLRSSDLLSKYGGALVHTYHHALSGAVFDMDPKTAKALAADPDVAWVMQDGFSLKLVGDQSNPTWGIDRIDERDLPDDNNYHWDYDGNDVEAYIIDTGIRITHNDFNGRAQWGKDCTNEGQSDGHGHGTHVAGTVGSTTYGVAKGVDLFAVKVCTSGGQCSDSSIICGVDYVTGRKNANPSTPMVANMSLGGGASSTIDDVVNNSISAGVFYAVSAGNDNQNACNYSPARVAAASTVGSTTSSDGRSSPSNYGNCVDIFAPGSSIKSTWKSNDNATNTISGTSMASPHVCGAGALVLDEFPGWSPSEVLDEINARATTGVVGNPGSGSPNRLLYTLADGGPTPTPTPEPTPSPDCFLDENFESGSSGWYNSDNSTCSTGDYVLGTPTQVENSGVVTQVGGANSGSNALFTGVNTSAGADDVDGGNCILESDTWSVTEASTLSVAYFHGQRDTGDDSSGDFFRLEYSTNGGDSWNTLVSNGDQRLNASWSTATAQISSGSSVTLRVQCSDGAGPGDLVECGIDDVKICPN